MHLQRRFALTLALLTSVGLAAAEARAETVIKGTFDLPEQAYWGSVRLPAGAYSVSVSREQTGIDMLNLRGEGVAARFVVPAGTSEFSGPSCLKMEEVNGAYVIREFDAGTAGKAYHFGVSKSVRNMTVSEDSRPAVTVPLSASAGQ